MKFFRRFTFKFAEWEHRLRRNGHTRLANVIGWRERRKR